MKFSKVTPANGFKNFGLRAIRRMEDSASYATFTLTMNGGTYDTTYSGTNFDGTTFSGSGKPTSSSSYTLPIEGSDVIMAFKMDNSYGHSVYAKQSGKLFLEGKVTDVEYGTQIATNHVYQTTLYIIMMK